MAAERSLFGPVSGIVPLFLLIVTILVMPASAQNGVLLDRQLDLDGKGYSVIHVWGTHHEMGYAHASLLADEIVDAVEYFRTLLGTEYADLRVMMAASDWQPVEMVDELQGMMDALAVSHPAASADLTDLKILNSYSDWGWGWACKSHACWGSMVQPGVGMLATRLLGMDTLFPALNHHVICAWEPDDGSPWWINVAWPGYVTVITAVNEYGSQVSLHDWKVYGTLGTSPMPRSVAARFLLTHPDGPDIENHLAEGFAELTLCDAWTSSFINHFSPDGHGGVVTCTTDLGYHDLRVPQAVYFDGEVLLTCNEWTDGTYTPGGGWFMEYYYDEGGPKELADHWDTMEGLGPPLHLVSTEFREGRDMTLWFEGRLDQGLTGRLEWQWDELFIRDPGTIAVDLTCQPLLGTVPFTLRFDVDLRNPSPWFRLLSGRIDVALAGGEYFTNWRRGYTSTTPFETVTMNWTQTIPALPAVLGDNTFHFRGIDTTPTPYNQPPYPPAGDMDMDSCTVTGIGCFIRELLLSRQTKPIFFPTPSQYNHNSYDNENPHDLHSREYLTEGKLPGHQTSLHRRRPHLSTEAQ
jgi:hypothetical protein